MKIITRAVKAFLFGGCIGLIGQVLVLVTAGITSETEMITVMAMLLMGILGAVLISSGLYYKLSEFFGFAADQPLCGLMFGAANITSHTVEAGENKKKAFLKGFLTVMVIIGIGFIVCACLGLIIALVG